MTALGDISWGGAFVVIDPPAPIGSRIIIEFLFADESVSLELMGKVVRIKEPFDANPGGVGVQFDDLDYDAQSLIQQLVDEEIAAILKTA